MESGKFLKSINVATEALSICDAACTDCMLRSTCHGCKATNDCPFGKQCFIAAMICAYGKEKLEAFKQKLIAEFNALHVEGMPKVEQLYALAGRFVNLVYPLPNGESVKFLDDDAIYLGSQLQSTTNRHLCYGMIAGEDFLLVSCYEADGQNPQLLVYQKR